MAPGNPKISLGSKRKLSNSELSAVRRSRLERLVLGGQNDHNFAPNRLTERRTHALLEPFINLVEQWGDNRCRESRSHFKSAHFLKSKPKPSPREMPVLEDRRDFDRRAWGYKPFVQRRVSPTPL